MTPREALEIIRLATQPNGLYESPFLYKTAVEGLSEESGDEPSDAETTYRGFPDGSCQECGEELGAHVCPSVKSSADHPAKGSIGGWMSELHWLCACKAPGNVNIDTEWVCKDCGTLRPPPVRT